MFLMAYFSTILERNAYFKVLTLLLITFWKWGNYSCRLFAHEVVVRSFNLLGHLSMNTNNIEEYTICYIVHADFWNCEEIIVFFSLSSSYHYYNSRTNFANFSRLLSLFFMKIRSNTHLTLLMQIASAWQIFTST